MNFYILLFCFIGAAYSDVSRTNMLPGRSTIVHLFEWKWKDIADECERFLGPRGFGGVQVSPASENLIVHLDDGTRPWYERYQVMSYKIQTRSGNEAEFLDMTRRCNQVGVRIYVDVVLNHMTGNNKENIGTAGSTADFEKSIYNGVPYGPNDFHPKCVIDDYNNVEQVRNCRLVGLEDLNHGVSYVRDKMVGYLNHLLYLGVAGFRVDAAKHMWPADLKAIYDKINDLNTNLGSLLNPGLTYTRRWHKVLQSLSSTQSIHRLVTSLNSGQVGTELQSVFRGQNALKWLVNWGEPWNLSPSDHVLVFIDNHDTQRYENVLTYNESRAYKDDTCGNGWVCEHRWRQIYQMVAFRNAVNDTGVQNWWDNGNKQIAFSRGNRTFIVFNLEGTDLIQNLQTGLPQGDYCDVITGKRRGNTCTGTKVTVDQDGKADIRLPGNSEDVHLAIHVGPESHLDRAFGRLKSLIGNIIIRG